MECYSAIKKNKTGSVLVRWMYSEPCLQSEVRKKNKYCVLTHICGIQKSGTDDPICRAGNTDVEDGHVDAAGEGQRDEWRK